MIYWKSAYHNSREARPCLSNITIADMLGVLDVNGAATEASASESERPTSARFNAVQSLAPSPHIPMISSVSFCISSIIFAFCSGDILANTFPFFKIFLKTSEA